MSTNVTASIGHVDTEVFRSANEWFHHATTNHFSCSMSSIIVPQTLCSSIQQHKNTSCGQADFIRVSV